MVLSPIDIFSDICYYEDVKEITTMGNETIGKQNNGKDFGIDTSLLPERFRVEGVLRIMANDYVVIGTENGETWCSWLYNPGCGFIQGHYRLTEEEALKELITRG